MITLQKPLAFFDLETTGTNVMKDKIIQIAILKLNPDGQEEAYEKLVNPGMPIPSDSTNIHGIKDEDVKDAPSFADLAREVGAFIKDCDLAGYNHIKFDIPLLMEEFARAEIEFSLDNRRLIDAQRLFFLMEPRSLTAAYKFYCQKQLVDAHNAMSDVRATKEILMAQIEKYNGLKPEGSDLPPLSSKMEDLHRYSFGRMVDLAGRLIKDGEGDLSFNFGKYKGNKVKDVFKKEPQYYDWIMRSDFPQDTKKILTREKIKYAGSLIPAATGKRISNDLLRCIRQKPVFPKANSQPNQDHCCSQNEQ